jgi:cytidylate kinase
MKKKLVITIDGPAGAGKSTVGKTLSKCLSYIYLDTGALYRAIACKILKEGISPDNKDQLADLCRKIKIRLENVDGSMRVILDGKDVTDKIRTESIGLLASKISAVSFVRETLFHIQRQAGENGGIVAEGRDMGTVIFPDADIKFFLDATLEERIQRRYMELSVKNNDTDYQEVERDLVRRDKQDRERQIAPLMPSEDAVIIDSTSIAVSEVVERMISFIKLKSEMT